MGKLGKQVKQVKSGQAYPTPTPTVTNEEPQLPRQDKIPEDGGYVPLKWLIIVQI